MILKRWIDFTETGSSAEIVAFDTEKDVFEVAAYTGGIAYIYRENVPSMAMLYKSGEEGAQIEEIDISSPGLLPAALKGKMECGLEFTRRDIESKRDNGRILHQIIYELDPNVTRSWIAYQLGIEDSKVFQGKLQL